MEGIYEHTSEQTHSQKSKDTLKQVIASGLKYASTEQFIIIVNEKHNLNDIFSENTEMPSENVKNDFDKNFS